MRGIAALTAGTLLMLVPASESPAHSVVASPPFQVEVGWASEPPVAGAENSIEVALLRAGAPVDVPPGALSVRVFPGDEGPIPLVPWVAGRLRARFTPPDAGEYALRVTGEVQGRDLDLATQCSGTGFECVGTAAEAPDSESGGDQSRTAIALAIAMLALGAAAVAATIVWRRARDGKRA